MLNSIVHHCNIYKVLNKMKFIVAADTQIGLYSHCSNIKNKSEIRTDSKEFVKLDFLNLKPTTSFDFEISNFNKLRIALNDENFLFLTILGDLINDSDNQNQLNAFQKIIKNFNIDSKIYLVPGNHDVCIPAKEDKVSEFSLNLYRERFGPDYYKIEHDNLKLIFLNSSIFRNHKKFLNDYNNQLNLLKDALYDYDEDLFIFMHHPLYAEDVNENKNTWNIDKETRVEIIDILSNHNKSVNIFSGHMHQNKINNYKNIKNIIVSSIGVPLGNDPSGYYKVNYQNKNLNYKFELLGG
ncbi:MAG: hypothetical protein CL723_03180 [Chloroflexi bacterium]|nr:hypothetical protein [Chloroflexota bacterium]